MKDARACLRVIYIIKWQMETEWSRGVKRWTGVTLNSYIAPECSFFLQINNEPTIIIMLISREMKTLFKWDLVKGIGWSVGFCWS